MKIYFLGTCSGTEPIAGMHHCSLVFEINGAYYWFDAGESCAYTAHTSGMDIMKSSLDTEQKSGARVMLVKRYSVPFSSIRSTSTLMSTPSSVKELGIDLPAEKSKGDAEASGAFNDFLIETEDGPVEDISLPHNQ